MAEIDRNERFQIERNWEDLVVAEDCRQIYAGHRPKVMMKPDPIGYRIATNQAIKCYAELVLLLTAYGIDTPTEAALQGLDLYVTPRGEIGHATSLIVVERPTVEVRELEPSLS